MKRRTLTGNLWLCLITVALVCSTACTRMVLWDKYYQEGMQELEQRRYPEAENLLTLALKQAEHFSPADQRRATNLKSLGACLSGQERFGEAADALRRALAVEEKASGADNPDLLPTFETLSGYLEAGKEYKEALPVRKRALALADKKLGPGAKQTLALAGSLAQCHVLNKNYAEAAGIYQRILSMQQKAEGADSPALVPILEKCIRVLRLSNKSAEADKLEKSLKSILHAPKKIVPVEANAAKTESPAK